MAHAYQNIKAGMHGSRGVAHTYQNFHKGIQGPSDVAATGQSNFTDDYDVCEIPEGA